ncbi:hypothetical protein H2O64_06625 [Kordia sp. YSTF-M3]|uniref:Uncharacterized protein n=1 Tax=Kordia aestuariivivens TaxID=2759037 RepID=A0ABR7Q722_9FLAO|nr:hypothetical protein [Kordia aestuariivivens]MBC8754338.1 hypothetical protein [Kordia aestuariivivens]
MSSYNDNLNSSVNSSLSAQELELQNVEAQREASMFSLYYAQGARITTAEELEITTARYAFEKKVHEQAIIDSDVSTNVLTSANNAKDYTAKSVTNTSVAAANVQIAANAILKLASDTGSIFSIINAADFDTDIYAQSNKANVLMNDTAYAAEQASQHSMEASASIAEVTTTNLADKATVTDTSIKDLLAVVTKQFDDTTALLATQSAELATANTVEKQAEGVLEDYSVGYEATYAAYKLSNDELNLDLTVTTPKMVGDHDSYTVSFDPYVSAFQEENADGTPKETNNPVESYNIMLVENSKSPTFSMNDAEGIIAGAFTDRYVPLSDSNITTITDKDGKEIKKIIKKIYASGTDNTPVLKDSEGKPLELGKEYTIFVLTVFTIAYKKIINTFDDYLSAPSKMFMLQNQLNSANVNTILPQTDSTSETDANTSPKYQVINFGVFEKPSYTVAYRCVFLPNNPDLVSGLLTVEEIESIENNVQQFDKIEYIYNLEVSMVNDQIQIVTDQIAKLQATIAQDKVKLEKAKTDSAKKTLNDNIAANNLAITSKQEQLTTFEATLVTLNNLRDAAIKNININEHVQPGFFFNLTTAEKISAGSYTPATSTTTDDSLNIHISNSIDKIVKDIEAIEALNPSDASDTEEKATVPVITKPSISDKLTSAEINNIQATIGSTRGTRNTVLKNILADLIADTLDEKLKDAVNQFLEDCNQLIIDLLQILEGYTYHTMEVTLAAETTDNFGNRLIANNMYIPAIISVTDNEDETVNTHFINALSDFNHTAEFQYVDPYADTNKTVAYPKQTTTN